MCGIVGYLGPKNTRETLIKGLKRLEYRGYDSAGIALIDGGKIDYLKRKGRIKDLEIALENRDLKGNPGIGHSRWATHGAPSDINAHPHFDCQMKIALVHNGIIENYLSLKDWLLKRGHKFISETDTEVVAHLIEEYLPDNNLLTAVRKALSLVQGAYALLIISSEEPDKLIAARRGSPLVIGICQKGEYIVASDPTAIIENTRKVIYLDDNEIASLSKRGLKIVNLDNQPIEKEIQEISWSLAQIERKGYPHFMLKEIFEQPETIYNALRGRAIEKEGRIQLGGLVDWIDWLSKISRIVFIACGTSYHAGLVGEYLFENLAQIPTEVEYASEFRYKNSPIDLKTAYFVISQSGETADTLESLKKIKKAGAKVFGLVNVVGSTISRETDAGIYLHAGPEIGVASTKAFTSQITILVELALLLAQRRKTIFQKELKEKISALLEIPKKVKKILGQSKKIEKIAEKYFKFNNFLYLGRSYNFPVALEGALKLKEISYIHAEGYPAAEMKHGPIALIDRNMPVIFIATDTEDIVYQKVLTNIEEVKARGGNIIALATEGNKEIKKLANQVIYSPKTKDFLSPLLNVIPLQLLAYYVAVLRGCDVDKPRNLAKSVTVE